MIEVWTHTLPSLLRERSRLQAFVDRHAPLSPNYLFGWLPAIAKGLGHTLYCVEAFRGERTLALLPLAFVKSLLFGRYLVSLPYLNSGGVLADDPDAANLAIDAAIRLSDDLRVRYLELRHEAMVEHPALTTPDSVRVHMRLPLPESSEEMWKALDSKVRNQVRKGEKFGFHLDWTSPRNLRDFYDVYTTNMRDLGTPSFGLPLFDQALQQLGDRAEIVVVRHETRAVAAALLVHGSQISEVPTAGSLFQFRPTNANMLMYWHLIKRTIERGQRVFDFGRSSPDSTTYRFKEQWGTRPEPAPWQYYVREGDIRAMRRENPRFQMAIALWRYLPVRWTRFLGPRIARIIP